MNAVDQTGQGGRGISGIEDASNLGNVAIKVAQARPVVVSASFTRPANTTTYAIGDVITASPAAAMTFTNVVAANGGSGFISKVVLHLGENQSTPLNSQLWLFDTSPTVPTDNTTPALSDAESQTMLLNLPLAGPAVTNATSGAGGNQVIILDGINYAFGCATGSRSLYGMLVAANAYTPVASTPIIVTITVSPS